jgi:L-asparaginase/Glu-tRNA(Gln) amidotransferase subunit D
MKNILLVSTGGTIGSTAQTGTINTDNTTQLKLLSLFQQRHQADVKFHCIQPLQLLSENLAPRAWQTLIQAIEANLPENYDGIIVTHGTDTLAYTACALSFYFHALKIPLLLVSSNYPLDDERANGLANFNCAVEFIQQNPIAGVFVAYSHRSARNYILIHQGTRLTSSLQLSSDFYSVQNNSFMVFDGSYRKFNALDNQRFTVMPPLLKTGSTPVKLQARFSERILMIKPYPGLNYQQFNLDGVDAVLHDLYHSGTACVTKQWGEQRSLLSFLQRCAAHNISVYLAPAIYSETAYHSTRELIDNGAVMLWNLSIEAAYTKLLLAYGNFDNAQDIMNFMNTTLADEHI